MGGIKTGVLTLKRERIKKKIYGMREEARCDILIISKCFITVSVGMVRVIGCHWWEVIISIINKLEGYGFYMAIHRYEKTKWLDSGVTSISYRIILCLNLYYYMNL